MPCDDRQLTEAQRAAAFDQQRAGVTRGVRPFTGEPTPENIADYLNQEVFPILKQARDKINETFLQVKDNAPSGNPLGYYFSTSIVDADPTAGFIRLNSATQNTATVIRVSQSNGRLIDTAAWLDIMAGGVTSPLGVVTLMDAINPGRFVRFDLNTMTDQGAYWDLAVTPVESSHASPFVNEGAVVVSFVPGVSGAGSRVPITSLANVTGPTLIGLETGTAPPESLTGGEAGHLIKKPNVINASISASQNNFSPTGLSGADVVNIDAGVTVGNLNITGIDASVFLELQGTELVVRYVGIGTLTLSAGDASSLTANRFLSVGSVFPVVLDNGQTASLRYCTISGVTGWLILPHSPMLSGATMGNRIRKSSVITATIAATANNFSPAGLVDAHAIYVTLTGSQTCTGIDSTVFQANGNLAVGREIILANTDATDTLTLSAGDPGSLAGNRFENLLSGTVVRISPGGAVLLRREAPETTGTWRAIEYSCLAPAKSVMANPVATLTESPRPVVSSAARQAFMVNSANTALAWRAIELADIPTQADDTFLANISGGVAVPSAVALTTLAGAGLTGGADAILAVGAGTGITVNANDVQISTIAAESFFMNGTAGAAVPVAVAGSTVAGAGLTYTTGGILAVGSSTSITVNANDIQRPALTGFAAASANSNATTSAEPIVTYSSSANMSAERVTTSSTSITVSTSVASQIEFQRAALTGAITAGANSNATLFDAAASGAGLTGGGTAILAVGAGTGITVNANDVAVSATWAQILTNSNNSGAFNPHIDSPQYLGYGNEATIAGFASGDIRASANWSFVGAGSFNVVSSGASINSSGVVQITTTTGDVNVQGDTNVDLLSVTGNVTAACSASGGLISLTPGISGYVEILTNGFLQLVEESSSGPSVAAGRGMFWVRSDAPNVPMFTDDTNVDHDLVAEDFDVTWTGDHTFAAQLRFSGEHSATLAAQADNLAIGDASIVLISLTGAQNISGMAAGSTPNGRVVYLLNSDNADNLTVLHDVTSTAANRFVTPSGASYVIPPLSGVTCVYNSARTRWQLMVG